MNFTSTKITCYISYIVQAININLCPVLFIPLRESFGLSYLQLGTLVSVNFITQLICDILFSRAVDRHGFRPFLILSEILAIVGLAVFALSPEFLAKPYAGFLAGTIFFSVAGGFLEIIISPLIHAIPSVSKGGSMALLHSFYAWGQMAVVLLTSFCLYLFGRDCWQWITLCWMAVPLAGLILSFLVPLPELLPEEKQEGMRQVLKQPIFLLFMLTIFFGGCTENTMVQWSSAYMERVLKLPKLFGDAGGMCMFACMLGLSRLFSSATAKKIKLSHFMAFGAAAAILGYFILSVSTIPVLSLSMCALTGFAVGMLWPGTLVFAAERFSRAGAWLFAFLAVAGDLGSAFGPWFSGLLSDRAAEIRVLSDLSARLGMTGEEIGMRAGMAFSLIYPVITLICIMIYIKKTNKREAATNHV